MILQSVRKNKIESFFIVSLFLVIVSLIVYYICYFNNLGIYSIIIAFLFSGITTFLSYYNCDKLVLAMNGARKANESEFQLLNSVLDGLVIASGLPRPALYVVDDPSPNAFATGRNPEHSVVCVTTGLLEIMNKYELEGVLAHELSHIKNYDILLSTVVSIFAGFVVMVSDFVIRYGFRNKRSKDGDSSKYEVILFLIGLVFIILSPIFTKIIQLAVSRKREYLADATSVEFTRNPQGLISALRKLEDNTIGMKNVSNATAHLYINEPKKKKKKQSTLFSTHPSISDRIERLEHIN